MPLVSLPPVVSGMMALASFRLDVFQAVTPLVDLILHEQSPGSTITPDERHGSVAAAHLRDRAVVDDLEQYSTSSKVSVKLKKLLEIAVVVQESGSPDISSVAVDAAKKEGATDMDIHDTVLIAAMFCMFNRYVDGSKTEMPGDMEAFISGGRILAQHGYGQAPPAPGGAGEKTP